MAEGRTVGGARIVNYTRRFPGVATVGGARKNALPPVAIGLIVPSHINVPRVGRICGNAWVVGLITLVRRVRQKYRRRPVQSAIAGLVDRDSVVWRERQANN